MERMSEEAIADAHVDAIGAHNMKAVDRLVAELRAERERSAGLRQQVEWLERQILCCLESLEYEGAGHNINCNGKPGNVPLCVSLLAMLPPNSNVARKVEYDRP